MASDVEYFYNFPLTYALNPNDLILVYDKTSVKAITLSSFYTNVLGVKML
jgi:hypothetical protein